MIDAKAYEKKLLERKEEINRRLGKIEADLEQTPNPDVEDRATERENDEVLEGLGAAGLEELQMIEQALKRIDDGRYGICMNCGNEISQARLDVLPFTPFCRDCAK